MLSDMELARYARQWSLAKVGVEGQIRLRQAKVLCIGAGGLGSPLLLYLAAAGVGAIGIVEHDAIEITNLHRQILYTAQDVGQKKVTTALHKLQALNPHIQLRPYLEALDIHNAVNIFKGYDIIVDGSDNFRTRYIINDVCFLLKKPNVAASVYQFEGQLSIFTAENGPCYRCLYPESPPAGLIPNCAEGGVLGVVPGVMGCLQATEVLKLILSMGESLIGRLLTFNALTLHFREYEIKANPTCELCSGKKSFPNFIYPKGDLCMTTVKEISLEEMGKLREEGVDFLLLDVREPGEYETSNMGGRLIPSGELPNRLDELDKDQLIIVHCKSGGRSKRAVEMMMANGFTDVRNLTGGITAWEKSKTNAS